NRYGFIQLDLPSQKRTIKKSGEWFTATAENNGFD
ncbi:TPA: family 1 glycosylhydrolase, partial [Yersinia enterocolitica]|nr:family 1 glycosylhydrolase [Yersinia enterocolitica]